MSIATATAGDAPPRANTHQAPRVGAAPPLPALRLRLRFACSGSSPCAGEPHSPPCHLTSSSPHLHPLLFSHPLLASSPHPRLLTSPSPPVCSGVAGGEGTADEVRERLESIACAKPPLLPSIGFEIPQSWVPAITFLRALRDGLPHEQATRRALEGLPPMDPRVDGAVERRRPYERVATLRYFPPPSPSLCFLLPTHHFSPSTPDSQTRRKLWEEAMRTTQLSTAAAGGEAAAGMEEDALVVDDALSLLAAQASTSLFPLATSWPPASCSLSPPCSPLRAKSSSQLASPTLTPATLPPS